MKLSIVIPSYQMARELDRSLAFLASQRAARDDFEVIVSDDAVAAAGMDLSEFPAHEIAVRGRSGLLVVRAIADGATLPEAPPASARQRRFAARPAPAKP